MGRDPGRRVHRLRPYEADRLREQPFTYSPVGATATSTYPPGFHSVTRRYRLGTGDAAFERAAERLMTWRMHAGAGLRVSASSARVAESEVVRCRLGPLPVPCRVVWVRDEPDARGFGYGTLPGHPVAGEESFLVTRADGGVTLTVSAYSRPALLPMRWAGPLGRWGQRLMLRRYARALRGG
jgi:uncharacterized protein (UPF0548 family)